jgi:hypothetical protein
LGNRRYERLHHSQFQSKLSSVTANASSGRSSQLWLKTRCNVSSPGYSCCTAASAFHRIRVQPAHSSDTVSIPVTWSKLHSCANPKLILVCLTNFRLPAAGPFTCPTYHATQQAFPGSARIGIRIFRRRVPAPALRQPEERGGENPARPSARGDGALDSTPPFSLPRAGLENSV